MTFRGKNEKHRKMAPRNNACLLALFRKRKNQLQRRVKNRDSSREQFQSIQRTQRLAFMFFISLMFNCLLSDYRNRKERLIWCKERSNQFWHRTVQVVFKDDDWTENFRMRKDTFTYLCNKLRQQIGKKFTNMRRPISVEERVAVTLWYLSTGAGFRTVAWLFGISKSSVSLIVKETCEAIVHILKDKFIKIPVGDTLERVIEGFEERWGFPQCVGAIDGSHVPITPPSHCRTDYYNRKGSYSIILQGLVNDKYIFTDICVGWPGKVHDARVFRNSSIFDKASRGMLLPDNTRDIEGVQVPLVILGDPAYPLLPWLMKPFVDTGRLDEEQKQFNYRLSRARMVAENAFGRLKGRWRVLFKKMEIGIDIAPLVVSACCVLHNICEIWGEQFQEEWLADVERNAGNIRQGNGGQERERATNNAAKLIRNALKTFFSQDNH